MRQLPYRQQQILPHLEQNWQQFFYHNGHTGKNLPQFVRQKIFTLTTPAIFFLDYSNAVFMASLNQNLEVSIKPDVRQILATPMPNLTQVAPEYLRLIKMTVFDPYYAIGLFVYICVNLP